MQRAEKVTIDRLHAALRSPFLIAGDDMIAFPLKISLGQLYVILICVANGSRPVLPTMATGAPPKVRFGPTVAMG